MTDNKLDIAVKNFKEMQKSLELEERMKKKWAAMALVSSNKKSTFKKFQ